MTTIWERCGRCSPRRPLSWSVWGGRGWPIDRVVIGLCGAPTTAHSFGKARRPALALVGLALGVCASIRAMADEPLLPPPRPSEFAPPAKPEPPPQAPGEGAAACLAKLTAGGAAAEA